MGAAESTSRPIDSLESLHIETGFLREKMDRLLEYSIHELTIQDFMKLSDPNHCKQYVMMMANQIQSHFYELRIVPGVDRKGVLFFREAKDLTTAVKGQEKETKDRLCLQLAYFYVRIFQIYGALALSIVDDMRSMQTTRFTAITPSQTMATTGLQARGARPYLRGGALELGAFRFLKSFLVEEDIYDGRIPVRYPGITFSFDKTPYTATGARRQHVPTNYNYFHGEFHIHIRGAVRQESVLMIRARKDVYEVSQDIECTFTALQYYPADTTSPRVLLKGESLEDQFSGIPLKFKVTQSGDSPSIKYSIDGRPVNEYMREWFDRFIPLLRELLGSSDIPYSSSTGDTARRSETTPAGVPRTLDINPTLRALQDKSKRPHGHCAARALQLLGTLPYGQAGESFICKAKFMDVGGKPSSDGLPEKGASLRTSLGLASTEVLFYDVIADGRLAISQGNSMAEYTAYMKSLARLFMSDASTASGLQGLVNRRDAQLCGTDGGIAISDPTVRAQISSVAVQLFRRQWEHAKQCDRILQMLFVIQKEPSGAYRIQLHPELLKKGIERVNEINHEARRLLAQYYVDCEAKYVEGMQIVSEKFHSQKTASRATTKPATGGKRNKTRKRLSASVNLSM